MQLNLSSHDHLLLLERTGVAQYVTTNEAAALLATAPQTMRRWSCEGSGPLRPRKVNGRLRWPVADIQELLGRTGSTKRLRKPA